MKLIEIAAIGKNNELGKDNHMLWHLPEDLRFFQKMTKGHTIVMGKNTLFSLPKKLKDRHYVVLSRSIEASEDMDVFPSIEAFLEAYQEHDEELFVIGGGQIYAALLPYSDELLLTKIDASDPSATVFFPAFDPNDYVIESLGKQIDAGIRTEHIRYIRKKKEKNDHDEQRGLPEKARARSV